MKNIVIVLMSMFLFAACADAPSRPAPVMTQAQHDRVNAESAALQAQQAAQASAAAVASPSTLHYYCATHPTKGGDAQGSCPECGQALVHNAAYHNQGVPSPTAAPGANGALTPPTTPVTSGAATNAAGVYHYTCSNGCAGGAGSQANCATCGNPLVHNAAYHN